VLVDDGDLADGIRTALAERDRLRDAGLERARAFTWKRTAARTLTVYREALRA
jgi:glycosyltransferase involved in cell wall biosynthesis